MHALHDRPYLDGRYGGASATSATSCRTTGPPSTRRASNWCRATSARCRCCCAGCRALVVVAACSPPDRHGYVSLGTNADYVAPFIGRVPFFVEANAAACRARSGATASTCHRWPAGARSTARSSRWRPPAPDEVDRRIAALVAERIPDGACIQAGIGSIPNAVLGRCTATETSASTPSCCPTAPWTSSSRRGDRRAQGAAARQGRTTFALGTNRLYEFLDGNPAVELLPVDWVNDPRVIAQEPGFVSINATTEVDFLGQAASETIAGRYWSGVGRAGGLRPGRHVLRGGQGFIVLPSTAAGGR